VKSTAAASDILAQGPSSWTAPSAISKWRDELEYSYYAPALAVLNRSRREVRALAVDALSAPVLLAAGRRPPPAAPPGAPGGRGQGRTRVLR